jgi:hypothetical protein
MSSIDTSGGWRQQVPGANGDTKPDIVTSFLGGYQFGQRAKEKNELVERELKQRDAELAERKRQFDTLNMLPSSTPSWMPEQNATMNGPVPTPGVNWDGKPKPTWQETGGRKVASWQEMIAGASSAKTLDEYQTWRSANPEMMMNPVIAKQMDSIGRVVAQRQSKDIAATAAAGKSLDAQLAVKDATDFAKRVTALDAETRAQLREMQAGPNGPSAAQWKALGIAEQALEARRENERKQAEIEALQRGDVQRTTITEKGVTQSFAPAPAEKAETDPNIQPITKDLGDGTTLAWMPGSKSIHVIKKSGEKQQVSAYTLFQIGSKLKEAGDPDGTNFMNAAKSIIRGGTMPAPTPAAPAPVSAPAPATTNAPVVASAPATPVVEVPASILPNESGGKTFEFANQANKDKVIVERGGKRYRLPKSQLADAQKQGYVLVK